MPAETIEYLSNDAGQRLAFARTPGAGPTLVWLCGFHSEMAGTKASALATWSAAQGRAYLRFDYSGHGRSEGRFEDGTISRWRADALTVLDNASAGPLVLIGSSMGAWMALLAALARPERVKALVLIAPAPDFTERLLWARLPEDARRQVMNEGRWLRPSAYDDAPYPITRALIEDGRQHLLLDAPIPLSMPIRILQGMEDPDVPWRHALDLTEKLASKDLTLTFIKDGDHRLSRPQDVLRLQALIADVC